MEPGIEILAVALVVAGGAAAALWHVLQGAAAGDDQEALFEPLREMGFHLQRDAREWLASRLPRLEIRHVYVSHRRRSRGQIREEAPPVRLAAREDAQFYQAVFLLPPSIRWTHDRLVLAFDPKRSAVIQLPDPAVQEAIRAETGWDFEAHGAWLVLYRREPMETQAADVGHVVDEGFAVARRLLGAGVR